jgi:hypothetical protein
MDQFSLMSGVRSGAGASSYGAAVDQTGNLLNLDPTLTGHGVRVPLGNEGVGRHKKLRFGGVSQKSGDMFAYPEFPVKGTGNGQAYPLSKSGYLPGNGGESGYGVSRVNAEFTAAADLTDAMEIACRSAEQMPLFVKDEHYMYSDKTTQDMKERMESQAQDYQRLRIKDLMAKGFSEAEIEAKLLKEREKAIDRAIEQPMNSNASMEATLARQLPTRLNEDYSNTSIAPGGITNSKDMSAYERVTGQGSVAARQKKMDAARQMTRIDAKVEPVSASLPKLQTDVIKMLLSGTKQEFAKDSAIPMKKQEFYQQEQKLRSQIQRNQLASMASAMAAK